MPLLRRKAWVRIRILRQVRQKTSGQPVRRPYENRTAICYARGASCSAGRQKPDPLWKPFPVFPFYKIAPGLPACVGGISKVNAAIAGPRSSACASAWHNPQRRRSGMRHRPAHRQSGHCLRLCAARRGHHCRGRSHRAGIHREPGRISHLGTGAVRGAASGARGSGRHRPGRERRWVCGQGQPLPLDSAGHLPPYACGNGRRRHCSACACETTFVSPH